MDNVVHLSGRRVFTREEATELIPVLCRITEDTIRSIESLQAQMVMAEQDSELAEDTRKKIEDLYQTWLRKVERLGAYPKGPWLVDLDSGEDYFCWKWPETRLEFGHGYEEGFAGRYPL